MSINKNNQSTVDNDNNINRFGEYNTNNNHSQYGGNGRSLRDYLQLDRTIQPSYTIFPLNIWHFEIKLEVVSYCQSLWNGQGKS